VLQQSNHQSHRRHHQYYFAQNQQNLIQQHHHQHHLSEKVSKCLHLNHQCFQAKVLELIRPMLNHRHHLHNRQLCL
jgi:hypothetical protein